MKRRLPRVVLTETYSCYALRIDGLLHLHLDKADYGALQSWVEAGGRNHCVEITLQSGAAVLLEYDNRPLWEEVLRAFDHVLVS